MLAHGPVPATGEEKSGKTEVTDDPTKSFRKDMTSTSSGENPNQMSRGPDNPSVTAEPESGRSLEVHDATSSLQKGITHQTETTSSPTPAAANESVQSKPTQVVDNKEKTVGQEPSSNAGHALSTKEKAIDQPNDRRRENRLTLMLGVITLIYFLTWVPSITILTYPVEFIRSLFQRSDAIHTTLGILYRLYDINACINIFIYVCLNKNFRGNCVETLIQLKKFIRKKVKCI